MLEVVGLRKEFRASSGVLFAHHQGWVRAVDGVSFNINRGETFGLVGESGCGKTTTARLILRLEVPTAGTIRFQGQEITSLSRPELVSFRRSVQAVFQDPWSSLNPRMRVGSIIAEPMQINLNLSGHTIRERVGALLNRVGLNPDDASRYPHQFSGGQRQRIVLARALGPQPQLIILDEPVSALDVSVRAQIMNLLKSLQSTDSLSYLLIAHHLSTVRYLCHRVGVMYLGRLVEVAGTETLFEEPLHPYTQGLLAAALPVDPDMAQEQPIPAGEIPSPMAPPPGCHYHPRCPFAFELCRRMEPSLQEVKPGHRVACHLYNLPDKC